MKGLVLSAWISMLLLDISYLWAKKIIILITVVTLYFSMSAKQRFEDMSSQVNVLPQFGEIYFSRGLLCLAISVVFHDNLQFTHGDWNCIFFICMCCTLSNVSIMLKRNICEIRGIPVMNLSVLWCRKIKYKLIIAYNSSHITFNVFM